MLDFYKLKSEVKVNLLKRWQQIDITADPLIWAWIAHAFSVEGANNNPLLLQALEQAGRWLNSNEPWQGDAYLGGIGLLCPLLQQTQPALSGQVTARLVKRIENLQAKDLSKFSRLNDPDVVFGLTIGVGEQLSDSLRQWLRQHCERNALPGNWRRGLLFAAAAHELKGSVLPFAIKGAELQVHEVVPAAWFSERYPQLVENEDRRRGIWEAFERIQEAISLEISTNGEGVLYPASSIDVAMLFEALLRETRDIDPVILFNNFQWHLKVRKEVGDLFAKSEYALAVFQAGVLFIDQVKARASHPVGRDGKALDGGPLMKHVFGSKTPVLKFNDMKTQSAQNEQSGLALIAEGIVSGLRNPKGHMPHTTIVVSPYEALDQLAIISYLMKRLDSAHT